MVSQLGQRGEARPEQCALWLTPDQEHGCGRCLSSTVQPTCTITAVIFLCAWFDALASYPLVRQVAEPALCHSAA
ncbi:hypothetical protein VTI28DRAFT_1266 [Corynascus sepedonium]